MPPTAFGNHSPNNKTIHTLIFKKTTLFNTSTIKSQYVVWLLITLVLQALIIVYYTRRAADSPSPPSTPELLLHKQFPAVPSDDNNQIKCDLGKVFVYDLPPIFNKELLDKCHDLDPWSSKCDAISNGGFGPKAIGLQGIVPMNLTPSWYWTDMYSAEVIYHVRMMDYKCRTLNPNEATAFYVPFYPGLAIGKYLWFNYTSKDRDWHSEMLLNWLKNQPYWKKQNGSDHFIMFGRLTWDFRRLTKSDKEWGSSFIYMPLMKNVLKITVERSQWDPLEISVPYPTAFHPKSESEILNWQKYVRNRKRDKLFCFVGATRKKIKNDFRGILMNYCKKERGSCRVVDCSVTHCYDGAPAILEAFLDSDFCLQPKGDGFTRRSFFDCMLAGSIPVYFWKGSFKDQYQWHMPLSSETYSVFIDHKDVRNGTESIIKTILEKFSREDVKKMRETVIDIMPRFLYGSSSRGLGNGKKDAFDITIEGVLRKFHHQQKLKQKKKIN
ncbi:hypothetical protein M9H77_19934 [Catharanthus roseus]|uniref:Uncharacterized protein n=1 Tax=Catharanthus roseus TaxID=4058 RepID=A0ACC0AIQ6_CATRO|nr:hypothetical protein M9H77_19934 [Catharanthus roseus]